MDTVLKLRSETFTKDALLQEVATVKERPCVATIRSASRAEWAAAGHNNLRPSLVAITAAINYRGETTAAIGSKVFSIYRTYYDDKTDNIELYLEEKAGTV